MKFWTKAFIIGAFSFVALMAVTLFIASDIEGGSNKIESTGGESK